MRILFAALAFLSLGVGPAFAACTSPAGNEGDILYNADCKIPQFCDGTDWKVMGTNLGHVGPCAPSCVTDGLVGHWKFDEGSGTTAADSTAFGNDGSFFNLDQGTDWVAGQIGGGLDFDGVEERLDVAYNASLDLTSSHTLSAWILTDLLPPGYNAVLIKWNEYYLELNADEVGAGFHDGVGWQTHLSTPLGIVPGQWYHVAAVFDNPGDTYTFFLNGQQVNQVAQTAVPVGGTQGMTLGSAGGGQYWDGKLDDIRIYNKALTADEVRQLFNNGMGCQ